MKHNWIKREDGMPDEFAWESGFHNGVICKDCGISVCVCCRPDYMEMNDCTGQFFVKPVTNADRIRAMSDEELAKLLLDGCRGSTCEDQPQNEWGSVNCFQCRMVWLQRTAGDDDHESV